MTFMALRSYAQSVVSVGKGSYASYTPLINCRSNTHTPDGYGFTGDQSRYMQYRRLYVEEREGRPIPTNDWWTNLITEQYSGRLWTYPQVVQATKNGIDIQQPSFWIENGTEMKSNTVLSVTGDDFSPVSAVAVDWHDWDVEFSMSDADRSMYVTIAHGMPFTWIEMKGIMPVLTLANSSWTDALFDRGSRVEVLRADGSEIEGSAVVSAFMMKKGTDMYGVYVPKGTAVSVSDGKVAMQFAGTEQYISVGMLNASAGLSQLEPYAYSVPRSTEVSWAYDAAAGKVRTRWQIDAESLDGNSVRVMQGFLPHHYRDTGNAPSIEFSASQYATPRGILRMAEGTDFGIDYNFYGMLPYYAMPNDTTGVNAFDPERMETMLARYAETGTFGNDTYWGGKGLTQMALYMMFAREMGNTEMFLKCRSRLKEALVDWFTFTPGERSRFFARYDRWGGLVGYNSSYDSETFNDHHFHYGYFAMASALLAMVDDDFRDNYGQMARLLVKDYANWDRSDNGYPLFRTFDPWSGHSFAGGMGDGNGNGQESSSEAMQAWGGMYLLGVALGDDEMRDAGLFGWVSEARGVAEYWFDRHEDPNADYSIDRYHTATAEGYNIPYSKFKSTYSVDGTEKTMTPPYNSNLTCHGVGWWTYFGYDAIYMQGIQWMPVSPALDYLSENKRFAAWDYARLMKDRLIGGWHADSKTANGYLGDSGGWGNVALSYLQRSDPDAAAAIFDDCWKQGDREFTEFNTNGITYFVTHSHRSHGDLDWTVTADIPTARAYQKDGSRTYQIYNPTDSRLIVTFSDGYSHDVQPHQLFISDYPDRTAVAWQPSDKSDASVLDSIGMENLALHRPCTVSGVENAGTVAENATDGDDSSRWGSLHRDAEWISVDLGEPVCIYKLCIHWETAYASNYSIELSADGNTWHEARRIDSDGAWDAVKMNDEEARFIRIIGNRRATPYGISIYELQAFGRRKSMSDTDILGIRITADSDVLRQNQPSRLKATGYTVGGEWTDVDVDWTSADGDITDGGVFTPRHFDLVTVNASTERFTVAKQFAVEEALVLQSLQAQPAEADYAVGGDEVGYSFVTSDQFGGPYDLADAGLTAEVFEVNAENRFSATATARYDAQRHTFNATKAARYAVVFNVGEMADTAFVNAKNFTDVNLALHKPAKASTENGAGTASLATDGLANTRWESTWDGASQQLTVDLKAVYHVNKVRILWENACAKNYTVEVSVDGTDYSTVAIGGVTSAGWDVIPLQSAASAMLPEARYVRIRCIEKQLPAYGYSIYELEVYGTDKARDVATDIPHANAHSQHDTYSIDGVNHHKGAIPPGIYIRNGRKAVSSTAR